MDQEVGGNKLEENLINSRQGMRGIKQVMGSSKVEKRSTYSVFKGQSRKRIMHVMQMSFIPEKDYQVFPNKSTTEMIFFEMANVALKQPRRGQ